jgi:hypothetical protein
LQPAAANFAASSQLRAHFLQPAASGLLILQPAALQQRSQIAGSLQNQLLLAAKNMYTRRAGVVHVLSRNLREPSSEARGKLRHHQKALEHWNMTCFDQLAPSGHP